MPIDFVLLMQTTIKSLLSRRATTQAKLMGVLGIILPLLLAACDAAPVLPLAVAADISQSLPTATVEPSHTPLPTLTPTAVSVPTPTELPPPATPTDVPLPRYDLVLVGGTLFDATGAAPRDNALIAIQAGRIVQIATAETLAYSADTPVVDLHGATILPGFINSHVHITGLSDDDLRRWTRAGVTTIRDLAGPLVDLTAIRERTISDPTLPRLLVAGPIVTVQGGYPLVIGDKALRVEGLAVRNAQEARAIVNTLADGGADVIKLAVSGRSDVHWQELSNEQIAAITSTAHARGLRVSAHVDRLVALRRAVLNGIDDAAHSPRDRISDEVIRLMVERGVTMSPTVWVYEALAHHKGNDAAWRKYTQPIMYDNLRRFVAAGGTLALGDDHGGVPDMPIGMPMAELLHWQAAGLSPQQIIEASTRGSATAIGLQSDLGTVEVGKVADLLIVQGNPLADLHALANPLLVIHNGQIVTAE